MRRATLTAALLLCAAGPAPATPPATAFTLTTTSLDKSGAFPARFTCDGIGEAPSLLWTDPPPGTRSLALVMDDPDAPGGTFTHWLIWEIPPSSMQTPEGVNRHREELGDADQGTNDFGKHGYGGPCPPPGRAHRYVVRMLALSAPLELPAESDRRAFDAALKKVRVLATAQFIGTYRRP